MVVAQRTMTSANCHHYSLSTPGSAVTPSRHSVLRPRSLHGGQGRDSTVTVALLDAADRLLYCCTVDAGDVRTKVYVPGPVTHCARSTRTGVPAVTGPDVVRTVGENPGWLFQVIVL